MKNLISKFNNLRKSEKGVALITVLGIIVIVFTLSTGMWYFSSNERIMSIKSYNRKQAKYLAESAIEACSKDFNKKLTKFKDADVQLKKNNDVTSTIYLNKNGTFSSTDPGPQLLGTANVTISYKEDAKYGPTGAAYVFNCKANVRDSSYTSQAYLTCDKIIEGGSPNENNPNVETGEELVPPVIDPNSHNTEKNPSGWFDSTTGNIKQNNKKYRTGYSCISSAKDNNGIHYYNNTVRESKKDVKIDLGNNKLNMINNHIRQNDDIMINQLWKAPNIEIASEIDLSESKEFSGKQRRYSFCIQAKNIIFDKQVRMLIPEGTPTSTGNYNNLATIVLKPMTEGEYSYVFFKDSVYITDSKHKAPNQGNIDNSYLCPNRNNGVFCKSGVYKFNKEIDLVRFAYDTNMMGGITVQYGEKTGNCIGLDQHYNNHRTYYNDEDFVRVGDIDETPPQPQPPADKGGEVKNGKLTYEEPTE